MRTESCYYEKHEFRNKETAKMYDFEQPLV